MKEAKSQKAVPGFNAATGTRYPGWDRHTNKYAHNQFSGTSNEGKLVDKGRGPTKGNEDHKPAAVGKPATKDAFRAPPECHTPDMNKLKPRNPDAINAGPPVRQPSGTRAFAPSAGQNYHGNPDKINVSGYSMGDGKVVKGSRPVAAGSTDGINYGPKKQY